MKTIHPAIKISQELYDELRDLTQAEQALLTAVHVYGRERSQSIGYAVKCWGDGTTAYHATVFLADRHHEAMLDVALGNYRHATEQLEEVE